MMIDLEGLPHKALTYIKDYVEEFNGPSININWMLVEDVALKALTCLKVTLMVTAFYSRPQTFAIGCYIGAFSPVIFPQLKAIIRNIESLRNTNLHWGFPIAGALIFSILPTEKWPLATLVSSTYFGHKLFAVTAECSGKRLDAPSVKEDEMIDRTEKSQSQLARLTLKVWTIIKDNGIRALKISAFLFLFALKPVVLPIAFVAGAVLPTHAQQISDQVNSIWNYNKTWVILFHLTIPLILPTYLWIAATIYGLQKGLQLSDDTHAKQKKLLHENRQLKTIN
jgi:hypothetical protein